MMFRIVAATRDRTAAMAELPAVSVVSMYVCTRLPEHSTRARRVCLIA